VFGSSWFTVRELRASERAAVQLVLAGWSSRRLGKLLARAVGMVIDGFVIERAGKVHGAACWSVVAIVGESDSLETPRASSPPRVAGGHWPQRYSE
jgi:hypothetical protein